MDGFKERIALARKYLPEFGLAAYCGFGRIPPADMPAVLNEHLQAIKAAGRGSRKERRTAASARPRRAGPARARRRARPNASQRGAKQAAEPLPRLNKRSPQRETPDNHAHGSARAQYILRSGAAYDPAGKREAASRKRTRHRRKPTNETKPTKRTQNRYQATATKPAADKRGPNSQQRTPTKQPKRSARYSPIPLAPSEQRPLHAAKRSDTKSARSKLNMSRPILRHADRHAHHFGPGRIHDTDRAALVGVVSKLISDPHGVVVRVMDSGEDLSLVILVGLAPANDVEENRVSYGVVMVRCSSNHRFASRHRAMACPTPRASEYSVAVAASCRRPTGR